MDSSTTIKLEEVNIYLKQFVHYILEVFRNPIHSAKYVPPDKAKTIIPKTTRKNSVYIG